jgi:tetratricopeptide (TPR) repeat protein
MEQLTAKYPDDHEAVLFYALGILDSVIPTDKTFAARLKAGALLEREYALRPDHPGIAHYIIHAYDVPPLASRALSAARTYAQIAPDVPHALHMPSHVFTRLGYWEESIQSNLRSAAAAKREGRVSNGEQLHALDYAVYAYLQTAQDRAVRRIVAEVPALANAAPAEHRYGLANPFAVTAVPARYALERHDWTEASRLPVRSTNVAYADATTHFARALGLAHTGQLRRAHIEVDTLAGLVDTLTHTNDMYWAGQVDIERLAALGWTAVLEGRRDAGIELLKAAADHEDATEKPGTAPGPLLPARELLADALLESEPSKALEAYKATLAIEPNRFRTVWGCARAAELAGQTDLARDYYQQLLNMTKRADGPERSEIAQARAAVPGSR